MALSIIGIGLNDEKDITVRGLEIVKQADLLFLENYTSIMQVPTERLASFYGKEVKLANRDIIEQQAEDWIIGPAMAKNVVVLIAGDVTSATTHLDLISRAQSHGVPVTIVHNTSVMTAIADTGLSLYKFGKTTSIPYPQPNFMPETFYDVMLDNKSIGAHTLMLLDLRPDLGRFMTVNEALVQLLGIAAKRKMKAFDQDTLVVGCARLGTPTAHIAFGPVKRIFGHNFGPPPHCLIVPSSLHFTEEEALKMHEVMR